MVADALAPLVVLAGPTASGKSALAIVLAERFGGEIVSCDSVAVYRGMDIGSAKPSAAERARVPHHGLDLFDPDQDTNAGDYARLARAAVNDITERGHLPIVAGGTGLYLRALIDGLDPLPVRDEALRDRLRVIATKRRPGHLHRLLHRLDPASAAAIHGNDTPKLIRAIEIRLLRPHETPAAGRRDALQGFHVLKLGLAPDRADLRARIDERCARMFRDGLLEETAALREQFGENPRAFGSLGYAQAVSVLRGEATLADAIVAALAGHRQLSKRQRTWFRADPEIEWLAGFGDDAGIQQEAIARVHAFLQT